MTKVYNYFLYIVIFSLKKIANYFFTKSKLFIKLYNNTFILQKNTMFKKIILTIFIFLSFFLSYNFSYWDCNLWAWSVTEALDWCLDNKDLIETNGDLKVDSWFKALIITFVKKISIILAVLAVWSVAYWSMVIVISVWNDEKIKKWRNIIQWSLVWFAILVSAAWIIKLIIYIIYWL